jgi:putative transcriptional regulator
MPLPGSIRENGMGKDDDAFDQLIASLGAVLALTDDGQSLGNGLNIPYAIDVVAIRNKTGLSQAAFARRLEVPVGTIRNWEQGRRSPQGPARILLALLDRNPRIVEETLG